MTNQILVIDDELSMRKFFEVTLRREGYKVLTAGSVADAINRLKSETLDLVLSDIRLGDGTGLEVLETAKSIDPDLPVIMMTAYASPETAVEAMKLGAIDYLTKPFNVDEVRVVVANNIRTRNLIKENRNLKAALDEKSKGQKTLIFQSDKMRRIVTALDRVAKMDTTILVTGESGTGKEVIMQTIHDKSSRSSGPFISVNCGALPETLFESELFGYEKGAFTGAEKQRMGLCESAKGGTLFLDEIGEMPLKMQIKLLRVLQERKIRRVGGTEEIPVDFRLLCATNRDLQHEINEANFREDLYYRISVVPISLPPLRERHEDIIPLVKHFLQKFAAQYNEEPKKLNKAAFAALERYEWPGNVRELVNTIERVVALVPDAEVREEDLPPHIAGCKARDNNHEVSTTELPEDGLDLEKYLDDVRFKFMEESLMRCSGVQNKSCELLGMSFRSFRYYLKKGRELGYFQDVSS